MFHYASAFNHDISSWTGTAATTAQNEMFSGATAFQTKFTCTNAITGPVSLCYDPNANYLTDVTFFGAINSCLIESPVAGECTTYGTSTTNFGMMPNWDVSRVRNMREAFNAKSSFNGDISNWNTSQVTTMRALFNGAQAFNQPIGSWDTSKVTDMTETFFYAVAFNQDISGWDTSQVTRMHRTFNMAYAFNQPLGSWNTGKVHDMSYLFYKALAFNQDISGWDISQVTDMSNMFLEAPAFAQDLSSWTTTASTVDMFRSASAFQAKFLCTSANNGPPSSCVLK